MKLVATNDTRPAFEDFARWNFKSTGDYSADCAAGRRLAHEFLEWRHASDFQPLLGWAVASIAKRVEGLSGLEVGFLNTLSQVLATSNIAKPEPALLVIDGGRT
jgi:hypothetical protein